MRTIVVESASRSQRKNKGQKIEGGVFMVKVKVYSTPVYPYCTMLKNFLKENNVEFEYVNVAENRGAALEAVKKQNKLEFLLQKITTEGSILNLR